MFTYAELAAEIRTDPAGLGYAPFVTLSDDRSVTNLLNAPNALTPQIVSMSRDQFLLAIIPAVLLIGSLPAAKKDQWERILGVIKAADSIDVASVGGLLDMGVADGLFDPAYRTTIGARPGSRAEKLWGVGAVVNPIDVQYALRG